MDYDWGNIANGVIALGASIESMIDNSEYERHNQHKNRKHKRSKSIKKQQKKDDYD